MQIIELYEKIISNIESPIVFEIGSNNGTHTNVLLSFLWNKHFKFYAFEPDRRQSENMLSIINFYQLNEGQKLSFVPFAIGNDDSIMKFFLSCGSESKKNNSHIPQVYTGSSSLKEPYLAPQLWEGMTFEETSVQCMKLDTFCMQKGIDHIDFIWMGVQGAEADVFSGGENVLKSTDWIYTEYSNKELYRGSMNLQQTADVLSNFDLVQDYGGDALFRRK